MKKLIISMIVLIGTTGLKAQSTYEPSTELVTKFNRQFNGATEVKWSQKNNVIGAGFQHGGYCKIAYYDHDGNLMASGRKISQGQLPMKISSDFANIQAGLEKKSGPLTAGSCYEFLKESGNTEYVVMLEGSRESLIIVNEGGQTRITRTTKKEIPFTQRDMIAKKSDKNQEE